MTYKARMLSDPEITREFQRVAEALRLVHQYEVLSAVPDKPRPGGTYYFDGVGADPLSTGNEGLYLYKSSGWVYLG